MIGFLIAFFVGVCFVVISSKIQSKYKLLLDIGEKSEGIVFDLEKSKNSEFNSQYPIIRFLTKKNEWITKAANLGISVSTYKQGDKVNVIYNPDKPEEFMIESKWQILISKGLLFAGLVGLIIGIFLFYKWYTLESFS
jgi:hypothetical protein